MLILNVVVFGNGILCFFYFIFKIFVFLDIGEDYVRVLGY